MKKLVLVLLTSSLLLLSVTESYSQFERKTFALEVNAGNLFLPSVERDAPLKPLRETVGLTLKYRLTENLVAGVSFHHWMNWHKIFGGMAPINPNGYYEDLGPVSSWKRGDIQKRFNYSFLDLMVGYSTSLSPRQEIYLMAGASFAAGDAIVIYENYINPGDDDWNMVTGIERRSHFGASALTGYNYWFPYLKLSVGLSAGFKYYSGIPLQLYTDLRVGFYFKLRKTGSGD